MLGECFRLDQNHLADDSLLGYIALMMEAVFTSETSIYFYETTWNYIPEGCHLHIKSLNHLISNLPSSHNTRRYIIYAAKMESLNKIKLKYVYNVTY
jgi:hypothetical protein